jgi:hypothetical protein
MATAAQQDSLSAEVVDFAAQVAEDARVAFTAFRETRTITANGTVMFIERVPGTDILVSVGYPGPFKPNAPLNPSIFSLDGTVYQGRGGGGRYDKVFRQHPAITTLSHVHSPSLGAWAQTHKPFPFHYVPVQRFKLVRELPAYIDRRQEEQDFILDVLAANPRTPGIIEANGGSTVWGWKGLNDLADFIVLLEEGADIQIRASTIGGSQPYGPGVLRQQWKMAKLYDVARAEGLLPDTDLD